MPATNQSGRPERSPVLPLIPSRVEEERGMTKPPVSPPRSSNRTCRFPASGFPTDFLRSTRSSTPQTQHAQTPKYALGRIPACPHRRVLRPLTQEIPHPFFHVVVHNLIGPSDCAIAEVLLPSPQLCVETIPHLRPRPFLPRLQQIINLSRDSLDALLRRPCRHI